MKPLLIAACCLLPTLAAANPAEQQVIDRLLQDSLLPRYAALDSASRQLAATLPALCRPQTGKTLQHARQQWLQASQAWAAAAALNWGPSAELRSGRVIAFRPARAALIEQILAERGVAGYEQAGAATKGFNAIEYALYGRAEQLRQGARCAWLTRNGEEIAAHTQQLLTAWQGFTAELAAGKRYDNPRQPLEEVINLAIAGLSEMHKEISRLPATKAEQISGQLSASGKAQLQARYTLIAELLQGRRGDGGVAALLDSAGHAGQATALRQHGAAVSSALTTLPADLAKVGRSGAEQAPAQALEALLTFIEGPLAQALDLTISFNEADGD